MEKISTWDPTTRYEPGDVCLHGGYAWRALAPSFGHPPMPGSEFWQRLDVAERDAASHLPGNPNIGRTP